MSRPILALLLAASVGGTAATAADGPLRFDAGNAQIAFRVYGMGLFPVDGQFSRFRGVMTRGAEAGDCTVEVSAEVDSLSMSDADMRETALAPGLLDAAAYPRMSFRGVCRGDALSGELTLHGFVGQVAFALVRHGEAMEAETRLKRAEWGMNGRPMLVGDTVRIRIALHDAGR